jgi:hypothetical protein
LTSSAESSVGIFHTIRPTSFVALQPPPRSQPRPPIPPLRFTGPYAHTLSAFSSPHGFSLPPPLRNPVPNRENSRSTTFFWHMCEGIIQNSSRVSTKYFTDKYFSVLHFYYSDSPLTLGTSTNFISIPFFLLCFHFFSPSTVHSSIFLRLLNLKTLCTHCVCSFFTSRLHTSAT